MRSAFAAIILLAGAAFAQTPYESALAEHRAGRLTQAESLYKVALRAEPKNFKVNYGYGLLLLQLKRPREALERFNVASLIDASRFEPYVARANAHLDMGNPENALKAIEKGEPHGKAQPQYWLMRAEIESVLGKKDASSRSLMAAAKAAPKDAALLRRVASSFASVGEFAEALRYLKSANALLPSDPGIAADLAAQLMHQGAFDEAIFVANRALDRHPRETRLILLVSYCYESLKQPAAAFEVLAKGIASGGDKATLHTRESELHRAANRAEAAIVSLDAALMANPNFAPALVARARLRLAASDSRAAAIDASRAVQVAPKYAPAYQVAYDSLVALDAPLRAEACLRSWIQSLPEDSTPLRLLIASLRERSALTETLPVLEKLYGLNRDDIKVVEELANLYLQVGRAEDAALIILSAQERDLRSPELTVSLALAYRQAGENAKAIATLQRMRADYPKDTRSWLLEASTYERMRALDSALRVYTEMIHTFPKELAGFDGAARSLALLGRNREAAAMWLRALEVEPRFIIALRHASLQFAAAKDEAAADEVWSVYFSKTPNELESRLLHAVYLSDREKWEEAIAAFKFALTLDAKRADTFGALAELLVRRDRAGEAVDLLMGAIEVVATDVRLVEMFRLAAIKSDRVGEFDSSIESAVAAGVLTQAVCLAYVDSARRGNRLPTAIAKLEAAAAKNDRNGYIWVALSRAHALQQRGDDALACLERAADRLPKDQQVLTTFATAAEAAHDSKRAAKAYGMLSAILPSDAGVLLKHAGYLIEIGEKERARAVLQDASERFPNNPGIRELMKQIGGA